MKEENLNQKSQNESQSKTGEKKISTPPEHIKEESPTNLSPDKNLFNQKYFPSKENFFGVKSSPTYPKERQLSPGSHSPILNYYSGLSQDSQDNNYSPKNSLTNNHNSKQLSPNFNYSPSTIFNAPKNNTKELNSFNNFSLPTSGNVENEKTLQEKMDQLLMKTDANNFIRKSSIPSNSSNIEDNKNNEEEDDDNEETFTLTIDSVEEDYLLGTNKSKPLQLNEINQYKNSPIFFNIDKNNLQKNNNNNNKIINEKKSYNSNQQDKKIVSEKNENIININNQDNNINNIYNNINGNFNNNINNIIYNNINSNVSSNKINEELKDKSSLVENIINKKEFKPYIPNKYRGQPPEMNPAPQSKNNYNDLNYNIGKNFIPENILGPEFSGNDIQLNTNNFNNNINMNDININNISNLGNLNNLNLNNLNLNQNYVPNGLNLNMNNMNNINNNFNPQIPNNCYQGSSYFNNFYYNGDNYQISNFKEYKKNDYSKTGEIPSITAADIVTAITQNNKKIKRIDPNTYLNESIEYLSYNIFPLAKDQAGCRFLQKKLDEDPKKASEAFYHAIIPFVLPLVKDAFGNYLIQKLCYFLSPEKIKKFLEIISPSILDVGSNSHGTRVIQHLINFLSTKELVDYFMKSIKPYVIPLLKELNGTHIINKFINDHPECAEEINKIIVENCSLLATHRHGCCILQKLMDGPNKKLKYDLINNLVENCFVLIIDQFGNYVIQSILTLNEKESSSAIAMKVCDNLPYYSKHRYSSNVIEKCFDFCDKKVRKKLIEKICSPEIITDLILDEHGNYVIQKALFYSDSKEKEIILNNIVLLIPKIRNTPFGEKLINRLVATYPKLSACIYNNGDINIKEAIENNQKTKKNKKKKKNKKNKNNNNTNKNNNENNSNIMENPNPFINNNNILNNNINVNNNITINNYNNFNNPMNTNLNSNNDNIPINYMNINNNNINNEYKQNFNFENNNNPNEQIKKKKKKKNKKNKIKKEPNQNDNFEKYDNNNINPNLMMMNNNYNLLNNNPNQNSIKTPSIFPNNNLNKEL